MNKSKFDLGHLERFRSSGLSLTGYCKEQGIRISALQYHLAKGRRVGEQAGAKLVRVTLPPKPEWLAITFGADGFRIRLNVDLIF